MKCLILFILLTFFATNSVAIAEEHVHSIHEDTANNDISPINAVLKATIDELGNSRSSVAAKIGKPLSISTEFVTNPNDPLHDNRIHTLYYDGIVIWIYQYTVNNKEKLLSVRITKSKKVLFSELIGKSEKYITSIFGQPTSFIKEKCIYDSLDDDESGLGIIELEFNKHSVDAVELTYYFD